VGPKGGGVTSGGSPSSARISWTVPSAPRPCATAFTVP